MKINAEIMFNDGQFLVLNNKDFTHLGYEHGDAVFKTSSSLKIILEVVGYFLGENKKIKIGTSIINLNTVKYISIEESTKS